MTPHRSMNLPLGLLVAAAMSLLATRAAAETIRIGIGTQDTTINTVHAGLVIRERRLLEKHLPDTRQGKYKDAKFEIEWKNFTSGPPLNGEMLAGKLDIGALGDFPSVLNGTSFAKAGQRSVYVATLSASAEGAGNGLVVPVDSPVASLAELKGKQISVPFGSAAHGMLLRAVRDLGWDPEKDVSLVAQSPEVGGSALKAHKIDAHADFVPFAELFPYRGYARKIYDGSSVKTPTSHGVVARGAFADQYPELVVAFLEAVIEADRWITAHPEAAAELVQKVAGVDAPVVYMFHGPEGVQTRELAIRPEVRKSLAVAYDTLKLLKRVDTPLDLDKWIDDRFVRRAAEKSGYDYDAHLKGPALVSKPSADRVAEIWLEGEDQVRGFRSVAEALRALAAWEASGRKARVVLVKDGETNIKLLADKVSYVTAGSDTKAFLTRAAAVRWAGSHKGRVATYDEVRAALTKQAREQTTIPPTARAELATDRPAVATP